MSEFSPRNQKEFQAPNQDLSAAALAEAEALESLAERLNLREQYLSQIKTLAKSGILENFPVDPDKDRFRPEMGVIGIDNKEYIMPSYQEILERLKDPERRKVIEKKVEQGFTKLLLVPFAVPISVFIERYKQTLLKTHKETGIKATDGSALELNTENPLYVWEDLTQSDNPETPQDKQMEYGVTTYDAKTKEERGGKYKSELLENPDNDMPNGRQAWQLILLEDNPDLPAEGQGQIKGDRKQLEANKTPKDYFKLLQTDPQYQNEQGLTPEANLTLYLDALIKKQMALDDWQGQGKVNWLVGNYLSGNVPYFCWNRYGRQPFSDGSSPDFRDSSFGFRPAARF